MKSMLAVLSVTVAMSAFAQMDKDDKVIYGDDNRHEVYDYPDRKIVELSRSTVALMKKSKLTNRGGNFQIPQTTFQENQMMCSSERFVTQPAAAFCSGFLIAPNKVVTAGHCVESQSECDEMSLVFDYKMNNQSNAQVNFRASQVYSCKKVLGQVLEGSGRDFAVIELDRAVQDREPLKLSTNAGLKVGDGIFVVGHPSGLPTKITDSANVRSIKSGYFVGNLDTYGGNSGSAVFNSRTLEVEGILVRGERDYQNSGSCRVSYQVANNAGRGEDVTLISVIHERGFEGAASQGSGSTGGEVRYIWLDSDMTCNEFHGNDYIREVANSLCGRPDTGTAGGNVRYVWLDSDMTCNEFHGNDYIREVANSLCGRADNAGVRYVWLDSDMTCNEFRGLDFIREVADSLCGH